MAVKNPISALFIHVEILDIDLLSELGKLKYWKTTFLWIWNFSNNLYTRKKT